MNRRDFAKTLAASVAALLAGTAAAPAWADKNDSDDKSGSSKGCCKKDGGCKDSCKSGSCKGDSCKDGDKHSDKHSCKGSDKDDDKHSFKSSNRASRSRIA